MKFQGYKKGFAYALDNPCDKSTSSFMGLLVGSELYFRDTEMKTVGKADM